MQSYSIGTQDLHAIGWNCVCYAPFKLQPKLNTPEPANQGLTMNTTVEIKIREQPIIS